MSIIYRKLCCTLLRDHFGNIVETVAKDLFECGPRSLMLIRRSTELDISKIKEALCVLIKFGFVWHEEHENGTMIYNLDPEKVLLILKYPKFMFFAKKNSGGDHGEMLLEEVLRCGYDHASSIIIKVHKRLENDKVEKRVDIPTLKEKFDLLVRNQFLMRSICTNKIGEHAIDKPDCTPVKLDLKSLIKKAETGEGDAGDSEVYWRVNFDRFIQDLRDEAIVSAITRRLDKNAGELMRILLYEMYKRTASWAATSNSIPLCEIREAVKETNLEGLSQFSVLDAYLRLLDEDSKEFVHKVESSAGGQFCVDMKRAFYHLAFGTINNIVQERFGSKAGRIFSIVHSRKYIEIDNLEKLAMMQAKEVRRLAGILMSENFLQVKQINIGNSIAKPIWRHLFYLNFDHCVRMELENCYLALYNIMQKENHESANNKRFVEKELRMQTIINNLKQRGAPEEQIKEIEEMLTPSEELHLKKVRAIIKKLSMSQLYIEETLFILEIYLKYH